MLRRTFAKWAVISSISRSNTTAVDTSPSNLSSPKNEEGENINWLTSASIHRSKADLRQLQDEINNKIMISPSSRLSSSSHYFSKNEDSKKKKDIFPPAVGLKVKEAKGWQLLDCQWMHSMHKDTFQVPSIQDREKLKAGDYVKLIFQKTSNKKNKIKSKKGEKKSSVEIEEEEEEGCMGERMWVQLCPPIPDNRATGLFYGKLSNPPFFMTTLKMGDVIAFSWHHVGSV